MSKAANEIEQARREYVEAIGTPYQFKAYLKLSEVVARVKCEERK